MRELGTVQREAHLVLFGLYNSATEYMSELYLSYLQGHK